MLTDIRKSWQPSQKLAVVTDTNMDSKRNQEGLLEAGYEYILAASMRKLPTVLRQQAIDLNRYSPPDAQGECRLDLHVQRPRQVTVHNPTCCSNAAWP